MSWAHESSGIFARSGLRMVTSELYSSTSVPVPVGWDVAHLGELFDFRNGLNKAKRFFGTGTPIVNYMDVFERPGLKAADISGRVTLSSQEIESFNVRRGDVFFTRTSETVEDIGAAAVMLDDPCDTVFSGFVLRARPLNDRLDDHYKRYCFASKAVRSQIVSNATYTTRALTNGKVLSSLKILIPPLHEQHAIATALSDMDGLLDSLDALIAKKRAVKQATMQQLLTGRTRLPGFSGDWQEYSLNALATITMGQSPPSDFYNESEDGLPLIQGNADLENRRTIDRVWTTQATKLCDKGDLLLTVRAPVGYVAIACKGACLGRGVAGIKPLGDNMFLYQALVHAEIRWQTLEQGSTFTAASAEHVEGFCLYVPSDNDEQAAIGALLSDIDAEIEALQQRRDKTEAIKQGMMQELLTGRVRLVEAR